MSSTLALQLLVAALAGGAVGGLAVRGLAVRVWRPTPITAGTQLAAQFTVRDGIKGNLAFYDSGGLIEWLARPGLKPVPEDSLALSKLLPRWN